MATKYIVNNVSGQTISEINSTTIISDTISATTYSNLPISTSISSGPTAPGSAVVANETDVNINFSDGVGTAWSFSPTGMTFPDDTVQTTAYEPKYKVYTALLTQSGGSNTQNVGEGTLLQVTKGTTYTIHGGNTGDFSNIGAPNNNNGTVFVATKSEPPNSWGDGIGHNADLDFNTGAPVVTVLENTTNFVLNWYYDGIGTYYANYNVNGTNVELDLSKLFVSIPNTSFEFGPSNNIKTTVKVDFIEVCTTVSEITTDGILNNTPIEIRVYN